MMHWSDAPVKTVKMLSVTHNFLVDIDVLLCQGWDDPYVPRTHEGLLKWKYPEMNSVDFLFEVVLVASV